MEVRPWPVRKDNEVALQQAEVRKVRWMCDIKTKDTVSCKQLRDRLGINDIISLLLQNRLQWYGHVLRKDDNEWVKKCMEYEVEGVAYNTHTQSHTHTHTHTEPFYGPL